MINWINTKRENGVASLYSTNITLNKASSEKFETCFKVMVGIDEAKNIIIKPLSKDLAMRRDVEQDTVFSLAIKKSYSRISSTSLMKIIEESIGIKLSSTPYKVETSWDFENEYLVLSTGRGEK